MHDLLNHSIYYLLVIKKGVLMKFWPLIHTQIDTKLTKKEANELLAKHTEGKSPAFYWGKTFNSALWGKVKEDHFAVRPVVPYWNISPVHIRGFISENNDKSRITLTMTNPHLRVIIPLIIITIALLMINFWENQQYDQVVKIGLWIVLGAYLLVIIPFQIQARKTLKMIKEWFD
ncbi:hypothetical protein [Salinivirga sp.]|uniref:hypothetical protein n=1 Tax=Salinivirga sp. TaxID=1970192 RepID=UPI002B467971|nr:hypothetical protein [Salinivirga sp.]